MANVSKIKLPDNTTRDIVDSRISSVDSTISSSSTGVVQNSAIAAEFAKVAYIGTGIDSATYSDGGIVVDISGKADKVSGATSGNFASLDSNGNLADSGHKHSDYQAALVSGTNIKTINNESLLGSGNITVSSGNSGTVTSVGMTVPTGLSVSGSPVTTSGTLAVSLASGYSIPTTSKQSEWDSKQAALVSGTNIKTINNQSLLGSGNLTVPIKIYDFQTTDYSSAYYGYITISWDTYQSIISDFANGISVAIRTKLLSDDEVVAEYEWRLEQNSGDGEYVFFRPAPNEYCRIFVYPPSEPGEDAYISAGPISLSNIQYTNNRVTSITSSSTDYTYPTAKAVYSFSRGLVTNFRFSYTVSSWSDVVSGNYTVTNNTFGLFVSGYREGTAGFLAFRNSSSLPSITFLQLFVCVKYDNGTLTFTSVNDGHIYTITWTLVNNEAQKTFTDNSIDGLPAASEWGQFLDSYWDTTSSSYKWRVSPVLLCNSASALQVDASGGVLSLKYVTKSGPQGDSAQILLDGRGLIGEAWNNQSVYSDWSWIKYRSSYSPSAYVTLQDSLNAKQATLVSGTNIKTINNESLLGSGNITISGGGDTSTCVHLTGDETISDDKTFTDNIAVVDASHILYSGASPSQGFTRGHDYQEIEDTQSAEFNVEGEPKAFLVISDTYYSNAAVMSVVGDSTGRHGVFNTGSQHNYSSGYTASYSNGLFTITAPSGQLFNGEYHLYYYYGDGTLTFKTSTIQPGSGVTAVTFTGTGLTEVPTMYACFLESAVNSESYRRVACIGAAETIDDDGKTQAYTFFSQQLANTTSSFSVSYNNGLYINSGGTNAGGYFHNPGTYTLYYLMASDIGSSGSGSYSSLGDELDDIRDTIGDIATILASI